MTVTTTLKFLAGLTSSFPREGLPPFSRKEPLFLVGKALLLRKTEAIRD